MNKWTNQLSIVLGLLLLSGFFVSCNGKTESATAEVIEGTIMTVRGLIQASEFGMALTHEHLTGSRTRINEDDPYDRDKIIRTILPHLQGLRFRGFTGLADPTTVDLERDLMVLYRLSQLSDMHIVTNTGYYGAARDSVLYPHAFTESADELAARWVKEWEEGIEGTGIKPGFIKVGVDAGPLSEVDKKLVQAAARTHLQTGLMIHVHTAEAEASLDVLETVIAEGVDPSALVIVHATEIGDRDIMFQITEAGAWLSFDHVGSGLSPLSIVQYVELIKEMIGRGFGRQIVISHDNGWYEVTDPEGFMRIEGVGAFHFFKADRPEAYMLFAIPDELIPALKNAGVTDESIDTLLVTNTAKVFTIGVRELK